MLIWFTTIWILASLLPATTSVEPFSAAIKASATFFMAGILQLPPFKALYKSATAKPSSLGWITILVSAFAPVKLKCDSIWKCLFISILSPVNFLPCTYCFVNSIGETQVPKKSAPKLTITFALSKLKDGKACLPNVASLADNCPL